MADNNLPFKRIYVDLPAGVHEKLADRARELGVPQKKFVADLITKACPAGKSKRGK